MPVAVDHEARRKQLRSLFAQGLSVKQAAERMGIATSTIYMEMRGREGWPHGTFPKQRRTRLTRVCLQDVPLRRRLRAAQQASYDCETQEEREDVILAAMFPSDKVYFVMDYKEEHLLEEAA